MKINNLNIPSIVLAVLGGLFLGWLFFSSGKNRNDAAEGAVHQHDTAAEEWTCSMHPQIRQPEPGKCPICGMDLIPVESGHESGVNEIEMSEAAVKLAQIQILKVQAGQTPSGSDIRLNGKIVVDERKLSSLAAHISGRIEELTLNFTGEEVRKGQLIARVYSPELVTAQRELLEAAKLKESNPALFEAAKEKLYRWKVSQNQVAEILESGHILQAFPIYAEASGVVQSRNVKLGDYVKTGDSLYEIQNLSTLWVVFDAYESELSVIKPGSKINFTVAALPGQIFETTVSYIDPILDSQRRVAKVRGEISNRDGLLKPEMFVVGVAQAAPPANIQNGLFVPKSAVLWTGERSVVYVQVPGTEAPTFRLQQIKIGPASGGSYLVKEGLQSGDNVVVNGAFTIDAAAQLAGKQSMMNMAVSSAASFDHSHSIKITPPVETATEQFEGVPSKFRQQLTAFVREYISLKNMLVDDNAAGARSAAKTAIEKFRQIDMTLLNEEQEHSAWMTISKKIGASLEALNQPVEIAQQRVAFEGLSEAMIAAVGSFGSELTLYLQHCPMAFDDKGANWLSLEEKVMNPYFGDAMLTCGLVEKTFEAERK